MPDAHFVHVSVLNLDTKNKDWWLNPTYNIATGTAVIRVVLKTETRFATLISRTSAPAALANRSFRTLPKSVSHPIPQP